MTDFLSVAAGQPWVYVVVLLGCILDGVFPPIPSESLVVGLAAVLMASGPSGLWLLFAVTVLGAFAGDNLAYWLGRRLGTGRFAWMRRPVMQRAFIRAGQELNRNGIVMILVARFIPVARVAVNLSAGATRYSRRKFLVVSALSATLWSGYTVGIGVVAGAWLQDYPLLGMVVAIGVAAGLGLVLDRVSRTLTRRRTAKQTDPTAVAHPEMVDA